MTWGERRANNLQNLPERGAFCTVVIKKRAVCIEQESLVSLHRRLINDSPDAISRTLEPLGDGIPIDDVKPSGDVFRPAILVLQISTIISLFAHYSSTFLSPVDAFELVPVLVPADGQ
jgi:hypothetical protein